ncbi:MAG: SWIM zinc finger family protein [Saprospiraceae bacterium]
MALLTLEKLQSLAPDPVSQERAKQCAAPFRWQLLEGTERVLWGEFKTPVDPFYTAVDLQGPGFKCSCPSRKFPCKHALGLALMIFQKPDAFSFGNNIPEAIEKWIAGRDKRKEGISSAAAPSFSEEEKKPEPVTEAKKWTWDMLVAANRLDDMKQGAYELNIWLKDLIGRGLASADALNHENWNFISKRMVDAKLSGIGRRMRILADRIGQDNWQEMALHEIGQWHLLAGGILKLEHLEDLEQMEILQLAGANVKKDLLMEEPGISDTWQILGVSMSMEESLTARRTWLYGYRSEKFALILDFAFGSAPFDVVYKAGTAMEGMVVFYPGTFPIRALVKTRESVLEDVLPVKGFKILNQFKNYWKKAIASNPWLSQFPLALEEVSPVQIENQWFLADKEGTAIPCKVEGLSGWKLLSISAGQPFTVFGEWDGKQVLPLAAWQDDNYFELNVG